MTGEKIANVLAIRDFGKEEHFLMFATKKGTVKKTALGAYANIRQNGIIAIGLEDHDELIGVEITSGKDHLILGTKSGLAIRFEESDVRAMGRPAGGVTGARFKREVADTAAAVSAVVDFFTAVAAASGNQVLALSQAPINLLIVPTLTRMIDRIPQARGRIQIAQARIAEAIKLRRSEQARSWMEKHIDDFKRGHELESSKV